MFVVFLLIHAFIFRDVIVALPSLVSGDASIVREELIPFFDFNAQFWGDATSKLTSSEEVRVSYSFWTAWVRHYQVLPFAIIIMNALSATLLFCAFHRIGKYFYKRALFGAVAAFLAALLIHAILLYAKMAHFYVLIIGFSMFALSISLLLEQLFFKRSLSKRNIIAVSLLTLLNPAIHYHIIFYFAAFLIIVIQLLFTLVMSKSVFWRYTKRSIIYFSLLILLSLVPYVLYIMATTASSTSDVSTQIPVNYWMIYYASLGLPFIFSLDTAGHLDLMRHGNYLAPIPRFGSMIVVFLIGSLFLFKQWATQHIVQKLLIITLFIVMLFSMWMTIGYSDNSPYSFHKVLGDSAIFFSSVGGTIGSAIADAMSIFINVLRFPHRFQFIYYIAVGILFMIALVWLREKLAKRFAPITAAAIVIGLALFPLVANADYRTALTSGDLATFVTPYRIPNDLKNIKQKLNNEDDNKLFILPTLESGREISQDNNRYSFLDKYLIYYLNEPTFYYGVGGNTTNKIVAYMAYRAIAYDETWWQHILANNLGITDIIVPKNVSPREKGITYLDKIDGKINKELMRSSAYEQTYSGSDYALYSRKESPNQQVATLYDVEWQTLLQHLNGENMAQTASFFPLQMKDFFKSTANEKHIVTDSFERTFYDLYVASNPKNRVSPRPISLPFNEKYIASTNFTNNALSLSVLYAKNDDYNYLNENVPTLVNLQQPSFIGLTKGSDHLDMSLTPKNTGTYRLLLHAASKGDVIHAKIGNTDVPFKKIGDDQGKTGDYIDFTYFYADLNLSDQKHVISLYNPDQQSILIDSIAYMQKDIIPLKFNEASTGTFRVTPTDKNDVLLFTQKRAGE